jgi:hypothetical protein
MLMHLCWPLAGHVRAGQPQTLQVICTVHGVMTVPAEEAPPNSGAEKPACALCSAAAVALPETLATAGLSSAGIFAALRLAEDTAPRSFQHSPARPRAPPAFS